MAKPINWLHINEFRVILFIFKLCRICYQTNYKTYTLIIIITAFYLVLASILNLYLYSLFLYSLKIYYTKLNSYKK